MGTQVKSKAEMLAFLRDKLDSAEVKPLQIFNAHSWSQMSLAAKQELVESIVTSPQFQEATRLIVRSSSKREDNETTSNAGQFLSVGNIPTENSAKILESIDNVVASYQPGLEEGDQFFVQEHIDDLSMIGVVFTCDLSNHAPYYVFNYVETDENYEAITAGNTSEGYTYYRFRQSPNPLKDPRLEPLLAAVKELEKELDCTHLDIEFAIDQAGKTWILQARNIVNQVEKSSLSEAELAEFLIKIQKKFLKISKPYPYLYGDSTLLGVMPDWNPAEIIGCKPRALALSMYKELVTDSIWAYQRDNYGYKNLRSFPLLRTFGLQPFVDVRLTLNSFVPKTISDHLSHKLVNYYLKKIKDNPQNHDKIEFSVTFSCFHLNTEKSLEVLLQHGFEETELKEISTSLKDLTRNILKKDGFFYRDLEKVTELVKRQDTIMQAGLPSVDKIYWLIEDCKRYGTLPFAGLARAGFIAKQFLDSFVEMEIISQQEESAFLASLNTVARHISQDANALQNNSMSREDFLAKYGHLRPGTYDIRSPRYDEDLDLYFSANHNNIAEQPTDNFDFSNNQYQKIEEYLSKHELGVTAKELISFIRQAIEGREHAKFIFTKSVSEVFVELETFGARFGFSRDELSHIDIHTVLNFYTTLIDDDIRQIIRQNIALNQKKFDLTTALKLPQLMVDASDVYDFFMFETEPNFVTQGEVIGEIITAEDLSRYDLSQKIVFIESADPGYDWIFSKQIGGLVTMFGGANSHMSIRAAELNIPAVIGVGEKNYKNWSRGNKLQIDCQNKKVLILS